eukprot:UN02456
MIYILDTTYCLLDTEMDEATWKQRLANYFGTSASNINLVYQQGHLYKGVDTYFSGTAGQLTDIRERVRGELTTALGELQAELRKENEYTDVILSPEPLT